MLLSSCHNLMLYSNQNILTILTFIFYICFIVWRNQSSLYQIKTFYNNSHIPDAIFFIKKNKEYFQNNFSNGFLSKYTFYTKIKNIIDLHYKFNDFSFIQQFTYFFIKGKHLSNTILDTKTQEKYKQIFDPTKTNSKKTLSDIIQINPHKKNKIQTNIGSYSLINRKSNYDMNIFFEKTKSSEFIHYEKLNQLSMIIAKEYDKQPQNTKESYLYFILSNLNRKDYNYPLFGFLYKFETIKLLQLGYYPINLTESLKIELISKVNMLLYLFKHSQNKMEYLMKQIIIETTFIIGLFIDYIYFLIWALSILIVSLLHIFKIIFKTNSKRQSLLDIDENINLDLDINQNQNQNLDLDLNQNQNLNLNQNQNLDLNQNLNENLKCNLSPIIQFSA